MNARAKPHGFVTKSLHWLSAALIGYGFLKGLDDVSQLSDPAVLGFEVTFAALLGAIFLIRLLWTKGIAGSTRLPQSAPKWEHVVSRLVHAGLYASVFLIVLSGLGIALGYTTPVFGGVILSVMTGVHELSLAIMPMLLLTHIAGALWHKLVRRDAVLESMTGPLPI